MNQYATFRLADRLFGLELPLIREINQILEITPVQRAPEHIRGLINLRGQIVTIQDLAVRLGMKRPETTESSHNIILKTETELAAARARGEGKQLSTCHDMVGFLVDAIGDVVEADENKIEPAPANVTDSDDRYLAGVLKTDAGLLVLLNLKEILNVN